MFIVVGSAGSSVNSVGAYLYAGQSIVGEAQGEGFLRFVIVDTGSSEDAERDEYRAGYLRDRLASGLFSARIFGTLEEAEEHIAGRLAQR